MLCCCEPQSQNVLLVFEHQTMDSVQKNGYPKCNIPSSVLFGISGCIFMCFLLLYSVMKSSTRTLINDSHYNETNVKTLLSPLENT
jgi:hypothetical protein